MGLVHHGNEEMAEIYGYNVIDPLSVMLTHLAETVKKHAYELLNRAEITWLTRITGVWDRSPNFFKCSASWAMMDCISSGPMAR